MHCNLPLCPIFKADGDKNPLAIQEFQQPKRKPKKEKKEKKEKKSRSTDEDEDEVKTIPIHLLALKERCYPPSSHRRACCMSQKQIFSTKVVRAPSFAQALHMNLGILQLIALQVKPAKLDTTLPTLL